MDSYEFHTIKKLIEKQIVLLELILLELRKKDVYQATTGVTVTS